MPRSWPTSHALTSPVSGSCRYTQRCLGMVCPISGRSCVRLMTCTPSGGPLGRRYGRVHRQPCGWSASCRQAKPYHACFGCEVAHPVSQNDAAPRWRHLDSACETVDEYGLSQGACLLHAVSAHPCPPPNGFRRNTLSALACCFAVAEIRARASASAMFAVAWFCSRCRRLGAQGVALLRPRGTQPQPRVAPAAVGATRRAQGFRSVTATCAPLAGRAPPGNPRGPGEG